ncbi:MAG: DNA polymerase III subunit beta, partial [Solirubrobacteraceae bacterium]
MKIALQRDALLAQLQTVSRVASTRSAIQALSGVQLTASASGCELLATDMDVGLRVPLEAEVVREGTVVLPARLLLDVVRSLPAAGVTLELRSAQQDVELVSGNATFDIRTLRSEDFPPFPEADASDAVAISAQAFVATVQKVAGSASRDETRPVLTGILVSASERELRMVATDSYRLTVKETTLEAPLSSGFEVNVPARALQELARLVSHDGDEQLEIRVRQNQVLFTLGRAVLSS